jgi:terminase small subunit-like protein
LLSNREHAIYSNRMDRALFSKIIETLAEGNTLPFACAMHSAKVLNFLKFLRDNPESEVEYQHAVEAMSEHIAAEVNVCVDNATPAQASIKYQVAKWYLAAQHPEKYAVKSTIKHESDGGAEALIGQISKAIKRLEMRPVRDQPNIIEGQLIDKQREIDAEVTDIVSVQALDLGARDDELVDDFADPFDFLDGGVVGGGGAESGNFFSSTSPLRETANDSHLENK